SFELLAYLPCQLLRLLERFARLFERGLGGMHAGARGLDPSAGQDLLPAQFLGFFAGLGAILVFLAGFHGCKVLQSCNATSAAAATIEMLHFQPSERPPFSGSML